MNPLTQPAGAMPPSQGEMVSASLALAPWVSAALGDPEVCQEYKTAIAKWFDAAMPSAVTDQFHSLILGTNGVLESQVALLSGRLLAREAGMAERDRALARCDKHIAELEADRRVLQSTGGHPAPCARHCEANAFRIELRNKDARIAEENKRIVDLLEDVALRNTRIAELEKQAAIDKALLALADARINRELRDDFAGRAMQAAATNPVGADGFTFEERAAWSYQQADAMLKAKGGA